jgi:serine/threonine protein kinase
MSKDDSKKDTLNDNQDNNDKEVLIGDYIIKKTIGTGTFSEVKLGVHRITQKKVAIKILDKNKIESKDDLERIIREMQILTEMNHQNVIKVFKIYEDENNFSLIMEYCEGGELFNYIVKKQRLSEDESAYFFYQIINGIEYIHSKGIAHRDLKPENLLIGKNKILKIIDFGLSNFYDGKNRLQTPCGSPCYASPEMVKGKKYDGFNIDIWAIGVILFAMLCGFLPFEDDENNNDVLFRQIIKNRIDYPPFLSELSLDILHKILVSDPLKRISIEEIKNHEFYLKGEQLYKEYEKRNENEINSNNNKQIKVNEISEAIKKVNKSEDDYEKKAIQTTANERENNNKTLLFLDYLKSEKANKKNNIQHKAPGTTATTLNKLDNNNENNYIRNIIKKTKISNNTYNNTINNCKNPINQNNNEINIITENKNDYGKECKTSNNIENIKKAYYINDNIKGKEGLINLFGLKPKKKIFTKLQIKNHKDKLFGIRNNNNIIIDENTNKINSRNQPYKLNLDIIKNSRNSFEKQNHRFNDEFNNTNTNTNENKNINNIKIINPQEKISNKDKENSLKKKLLKYNIRDLKPYNRLVNQINTNNNNITRSAQKNKIDYYTKPNFTNNNNIINLNVILNDSLNNNKNLESLQMANNIINKIKKNLPATPSQMRFLPSKKSTLPSITISDRIKPKINARKFKSINNSKYLNTESNYERIERQKRIFLDNVIKRHEYFRVNYPKNYRINTNIFNN